MGDLKVRLEYSWLEGFHQKTFVDYFSLVLLTQSSHQLLSLIPLLFWVFSSQTFSLKDIFPSIHRTSRVVVEALPLMIRQFCLQVYIFIFSGQFLWGIYSFLIIYKCTLFIFLKFYEECTLFCAHFQPNSLKHDISFFLRFLESIQFNISPFRAAT